MQTKYYEESNHGYNSKSLVETDSRFANIADTIKKSLPSGSRVLDIGCGDMHMQNMLPEYDFHGLDINPVHPKSVKCDLTVTPYPVETGAFDGVLCSEFLEHLFEPIKPLQEARR